MQGLLSFWSTLSNTGSVVVGYGLRCSTAYGMFPDQGSNLCLLPWQADSLLLSHQGKPWGKAFRQSEGDGCRVSDQLMDTLLTGG